MRKEEDSKGRKPRELVSSAGFSVEYESRVFDQELRDDVVSYLGEYRFKLQKYDYELVFSPTSEEGWRLRDPHRLEAMGIKAERSIDERRLRSESTHRETAEAVGIELLEKQLETAEEGDSVVWASPPGSKEEGYGDYGFFYIGKVRRSVEAKKEVAMTAIRVENPTLEQFNRAFQELSGVAVNFSKAEDFISKPVITAALAKDLVDDVLLRNFALGEDPTEQTRFASVIERIRPRIDQFIRYVRFGTTEEKKKAFHALENLALQVKKDLETGLEIVFEQPVKFQVFIDQYGFEPPKVAGSCPIKSPNLLGQYQALNKALGKDKQEWFTCPKCNYKADGPVGNSCPGCGLTKEAYIEETGAEACD
jgi:hypothetical protein